MAAERIRKVFPTFWSV